MGRGIERTKIFPTDTDRADFVERLAGLCRQGHLVVYAWALMPNHFHLLVRTGARPLFRSMKQLLTGYVVNFNRRHKRTGHLFQNRYKSIVVEEDPYLLELTRYIHVNPLRGGPDPRAARVTDLPLDGPRRTPGEGAPGLAGNRHGAGRLRAAPWRASQRYEEFVRDGIPQGRRPDLVGGGLIRSLGGWAQVLSLRRKGSPVASDPRVLGSGKFVEQLLREAASREKETLRFARKVIDLPTLAQHLTAKGDVAGEELQSGIRTRGLVRARRLFCQVAIRGMGYSGAEVARFLGVTTSAVNRLAVSPELPEVRKYLKAL
jgi:REP element-mobilizing transposase RayT